MKNTKSIREMAQLIKIGKYPYNRILMEKEKRGLTYNELRDELKKKSGIEISAENLKKKLTSGRKPDPDLVEDLNSILDIKGEISNEEASAIYYYMMNRPQFKGFKSINNISDFKEEQNKVYDEILQRKSDFDKGEYNIDKLILDGLDYADEEEYFEMELAEKERLEEIDFLKRVLLIYREIPQLFDEILSVFNFEDEDEEKLKNIEIEIHEQY